MNLIDVYSQFQTEEQCFEYWEKVRWPNGPRCTTCGSDKFSVITRQTKSKNKRARIFSCLEPSCRQQFSATSGTIFHDSHLPLSKWFTAIALIVDAKKGISAKQLQRHLRVSYGTAWHLAHRIRRAMEDTGNPLLAGTVEIDETYIGGKTIRRKDRGNRKYESKDAVMGMIQRGGQLRMRYIGKGSATSAKVAPLVREHVSRGVERVITDESIIYPIAFDGFCASKHETIAHKYEYVRGDVYTNTIESAFSLLKRGIMGSFHKISIKHLPRYLSEFEYRFNRRKTPGMFEETLQRIATSKPLTYGELTADKTTQN